MSNSVGNYYFGSIQALRFFAALAVVVLHCQFYVNTRLGADIELYRLGANGVRVFFAISGFVMVFSASRLANEDRGYSIFILNRVKRIVPMYWIATTMQLSILIFLPSLILHNTLDWIHVFLSYFFIPAPDATGKMEPLHGVGWTLLYEMYFYVVFAAGLFFRRDPVIFTSLFLLVVVILGKTFKADNIYLEFYSRPIVFDFIVGMIVAKFVMNGAFLPKGAATAGVICAVSYLFLPHAFFPKNGLVLSLTVSVASGFLIAGLCALESERLISAPNWLLLFGASSYSLYLMHPFSGPVFPVLFKILNVNYAMTAVVISVFASLLVGLAFYLVLERRIDSLFGKFRIRRF